MSRQSGPRILFLVVEDWFFRTHRLPLARACREAGAEVFVMAHVNGPTGDLEAAGLQVIPWRFRRGSLNPLREILSLARVVQVYRHLRPDLVHHVSLKPVVYGGLVARWFGVPAVNAVTGLGHVFTANSIKMRVLGRSLIWLLLAAMRRSRSKAIFQNPEDMETLVSRGIVSASDSMLIRGAGVDLSEFVATPEPQGTATVVLATRMLWNKGVGVFVEAARELRNRGVSARFVLVGDPDPENPASVSHEQLRQWHASGVVEWWPKRSDMPLVFSQSNIVCFPSYYGEGVPKVLLEAAACGRAAITTDSPGCRGAVRHGENGLLVPPRDSAALAEAILRLLEDPALRARMGARGREIAVGEFAVERVIAETLEVYRSLLRFQWPRSEAPARPAPASAD